MAMTRTTISFSHEELDQLRDAAKRQGSSVSQFVREAALMRATMASDAHPFPLRDLAERLRQVAADGLELAREAQAVAEAEFHRRR